MDFAELLQNDRKRADQLLDHHLAYNDFGDWIAVSSHLKDYQDSFRDVMYPLTGYRSLQNVIYNWGIPKEQVIGVNFMGETLPLDELGISGFGCELIDNKREINLREKDKIAGRTVIEGDLDSEQTWQKIKKQLGNKKINLALWRSVAGVTTLPVLPHSIFRQIYKADQLMDHDHSLYLAGLNSAASTYTSESTPLLVQFI